MPRLLDDLALIAQLSECRSTLRFLHGVEYDRLIQPWRAVLLAPPARPAATLLAHAIQIAHDEFGGTDRAATAATMWLLAAALDLIVEQPGT